MPINLGILRDEIIKDPMNLGYSPFVESGDDIAICNILNATNGNGVGEIVLNKVSRNIFLTAIRLAYLSLPTLSVELQTKWDRILNALNTSDEIVIDTTTLFLLQSAVNDNVLTSEQAYAAWHRNGTRAEVILGADVIVSHSDVSSAIRGVD